MLVAPSMSKDDVRLDRPKRLERVFDLRPCGGKIAFAKGLHDDGRLPCSHEKVSCAGARFGFALRVSRKDDPIHRAARAFGEQPEHGATATDLDVVAVRAQAQNAERSVGAPTKG